MKLTGDLIGMVVGYTVIPSDGHGLEANPGAGRLTITERGYTGPSVGRGCLGRLTSIGARLWFPSASIMAVSDG